MDKPGPNCHIMSPMTVVSGWGRPGNSKIWSWSHKLWRYQNLDHFSSYLLCRFCTISCDLASMLPLFVHCDYKKNQAIIELLYILADCTACSKIGYWHDTVICLSLSNSPPLAPETLVPSGE